MKIKHIGAVHYKPKNFSRKNLICSCLCRLAHNALTLENVNVKYEIKPSGENHLYVPKLKNNQWATYQHWGYFEKVIELPPVFEKLDEEDYLVKVGSFTRDHIQMPFIYEIQILNSKKYELLKNQLQRRKKLNNLNNI